MDLLGPNRKIKFQSSNHRINVSVPGSVITDLNTNLVVPTPRTPPKKSTGRTSVTVVHHGGRRTTPDTHPHTLHSPSPLSDIGEGVDGGHGLQDRDVFPERET